MVLPVSCSKLKKRRASGAVQNAAVVLSSIRACVLECAGVPALWMPLPLRHPGVMKQILLRVPAMFSEVRLRELPQPPCGHFLSRRKIMLPQHSFDPDINGERSQPFIRKQHHAIGNLWPHAGQRAESFSELGIGQSRPRLEIRLAGTNELRGRAQIFGAIAELTVAQLLLRRLCKLPGRRKRVHELMADLLLLAKSATQRQRNLADVRHLFHRRANKRG